MFKSIKSMINRYTQRYLSIPEIDKLDNKIKYSIGDLSSILYRNIECNRIRRNINQNVYDIARFLLKTYIKDKTKFTKKYFINFFKIELAKQIDLNQMENIESINFCLKQCIKIIEKYEEHKN